MKMKREVRDSRTRKRARKGEGNGKDDDEVQVAADADAEVEVEVENQVLLMLGSPRVLLEGTLEAELPYLKFLDTWRIEHRWCQWLPVNWDDCCSRHRI